MPALQHNRRTWAVLCFAFSIVLLATGSASSGQPPTSTPLSLAVLPQWAASNQPPGEGPWVVRAYFRDRQMVNDLAAWREPWEVDHDRGFVILDVDRTAYQRLLDAGFRLEVDVKLTAQLNQPNVRSFNQVTGIPGYACYHTVEEAFALAETMTTEHPELATWVDVGDTWEKVEAGGSAGYDMMVLRLTNSAIPGPKPKLFIMTSVHAREYAPAELNTRFAQYLVDNYNADPDVTWLLDYHEIHLLLLANPDGRKQAETGLLWRKNTNQNYCSPTSNYRGADLNRNFEFQWGCCGGSSSSQCNEVYRGPGAASEPETQAIQSYLRAQFPDQRGAELSAAAPVTATGIFLDIHSHGNLVLWPWGFTQDSAPNGTALQTMGRKLAYFNGYNPSQAIGLYPTDGTTDGFAYGDLGLAAFAFELGTSFFQDCTTFENTILPDNLPALVYAAKVARRPYMTPSGPDTVNPNVAPGLATLGASVRLTASVNDTRYSTRNGGEPIQTIAAAEYYIDVPLWITSTTPVPYPMTPIDGVFDQEREEVEAEIDTTDLSEGRHTIFMRGQDADGNWGAISAVFLYIADPLVGPTVEGYVRSFSDSRPLQATITAKHFRAETDAASGFYRMTVISGSYDLEATAAGHVISNVNSVNVHNSQTVRQDFYLFPECEILSDDIESGNQGWTAEGNWSITDQDFHSAGNSWTDSPGDAYGNFWNYALISPILDLSGYQEIGLNFRHIYDLEASWDWGYVEYSIDGGANWSQVASYSGEEQTIWSREALSLPALDGQANARIRFRLNSDGSVVRDGWHIDDITLVGGGLGCVIPVSPTVEFVSNSPVSLGGTAVFTSWTTGTQPLSYLWDFGDSLGTSTDSDPSYTYLSTGTFTVRLTAANNVGSGSKSHPVVVNPVQTCTPVEIVDLESNDPVVLSETLYLTATIAGRRPITYTWDFGDGGESLSGTGLDRVTHSYALSNTYTITLGVTNGCPSGDSMAMAVRAVETVVEDKDLRIYLPIIIR